MVHEVFICKPGQASKFAKMFKEVGKLMGEQSYVMTDLVGQYNKVIVAMPYESMAAFEENMKKWGTETNTAKGKKIAALMKNYHDMFLTGQREIYRVM